MSLDIKISGAAGSGKTTVARIIGKALVDAGLIVYRKMEEDDFFISEEQFEKCKKSLQGSEVSISCQQTRNPISKRSSFPWIERK